MDAKRAEHLMNIARKEQSKAFAKWHNMSPHTPEPSREAARLDCAAWAQAGDELYKIVERKEVKHVG